MEWVQLIMSLCGVIGLILFMYFFFKRLNRKGRIIGLSQGNKLRVIDRVILGRDEVLSVVSVAGKLMIIGTGGGRVKKICDLEMTEEEYLTVDGENTAENVSFMDIMRELSNSFKGRKEK